MIATEFEFDGIRSSVFGLYICSFDGSKDGLATIGGAITFNNAKSPKGNKWIYTDSVYEEPLTFTFQCFKHDCSTGTEPIGGRELARIMRWLERNDGYHPIRFLEDEWDNVFYNAKLKLQKYEVGGKPYGFEIEVTCDAPWGYSELKEYDSKGNTIFNLYNYSDEDGELLPDLVKIEVAKNCDLAITNTFNLKGDINNPYSLTTHIDNCVAGEIIYLDKNKNIMSSVEHSTLADDFDYNFLYLYSDFINEKNTITVNNPCNITIYWREIRKGVC